MVYWENVFHEKMQIFFVGVWDMKRERERDEIPIGNWFRRSLSIFSNMCTKGEDQKSFRTKSKVPCVLEIDVLKFWIASKWTHFFLRPEGRERLNRITLKMTTIRKHSEWINIIPYISSFIFSEKKSKNSRSRAERETNWKSFQPFLRSGIFHEGHSVAFSSRIIVGQWSKPHRGSMTF